MLVVKNIAHEFDIFCNTKIPIKVDMESFLRCADLTTYNMGYQVSLTKMNFHLLYIIISGSHFFEQNSKI